MSPTVEDVIAGKDRLIGELYSRCRALEEAYRKIVAERDEEKQAKKETP